MDREREGDRERGRKVTRKREGGRGMWRGVGIRSGMG